VIDVLANSPAAAAVRKVVATNARVAAFRSGTARRYLENEALIACLRLYEPGAFVPWVSYLFPPEILTSYGLVPLIPEIAAATLTGSPFRQQVEVGVNRLHLSRDTCSYHRAAFAALHERLLPPPSVCMGTTPFCLGKECMLDTVAQEYGVPFRSVQVPMPPDEGPAPPEAIAGVAEQLRELHDDLGRLTGLRARMERAVTYSNRAGEAWREFTRRRYAGELLVDGRHAFTFSFVGEILLGTESGAKGFEKLLSERGRRDLALPSSVADPHPRLLWLHTVPHHDHSLHELITSRGGAVVFEEIVTAELRPLDPRDPFSELARRLIEHPLWGSASRRARLVLELVEHNRIDGVVHFNHWGCRQGMGSLPVLHDALSRARVPFLAIDGDALDQPGAGNTVALNQMESFLEML